MQNKSNKINEKHCFYYKKMLSLIFCCIFLFIITGCKNSNNEIPNNTNNNNETQVKEEKENSYLAKITDNFNVEKFDSSKFNGLIYKKDEVVDIKNVINEHYKENNFYLQYYMDGFEQAKNNSDNKKYNNDILDSKSNYYYNILGEPSSICGIYYDWGSYEGPTGLIEFVWQYDDYSIRVSMADYSNWSKDKPTSTKFLGATAYTNENAKNEVPKSIGYWDKDGKVHEKKCVGIDLLSD